jgi:hypothetical protein
MTPAQIADICDGRDKAIALWLGLYDTYHATRDEAARLTLGGPLSLSCGRDWTEDTLTRAFSCHRLSWRRLRRQAAALICRGGGGGGGGGRAGGRRAAPGLFLPPAARARPSPPLRGSAWRSGGFPRPSFAALRAGRVIPLPPDRPRLRHSPAQRRPLSAEVDDPSSPSAQLGRESP